MPIVIPCMSFLQLNCTVPLGSHRQRGALYQIYIIIVFIIVVVVVVVVDIVIVVIIAIVIVVIIITIIIIHTPSVPVSALYINLFIS